MKSDILRKLRKDKKLTQGELSKELGVARSLIGMIETGKQEGGRDFVKKVAEYFNVSIDYLEGKTDYKQGISIEKESLVSEFLNFLVKSGVVKDENNIDKKTQDMIMEMVRREVAKIKEGE